MKAKMDHSTFLHFFSPPCTMFNIFRLFAGSIYSLSSLAGDEHLAYSVREWKEKKWF